MAPEGGHRLRRGAAEVAVVFLVYLGLACAVTWPSILHIDEVILGGGELASEADGVGGQLVMAMICIVIKTVGPTECLRGGGLVAGCDRRLCRQLLHLCLHAPIKRPVGRGLQRLLQVRRGPSSI